VTLPSDGCIELKSHAKLNIYLRVFEPDATGYHPIDSVFQLIALHDHLTITPADRMGVTFVSPQVTIPPGSSTIDTVLRALAPRLRHPVHVTVIKRIPVGGGLGGGSSNAAAVIKGLGPWLSSPLTKQETQELAQSIGMDVPFFLGASTAHVQGYGEIVTPCAPILTGEVQLLIPNTAMWSGQAYRSLDDTRHRLPDWTHDAQNDFKPVVWAHIPVLATLATHAREWHLPLYLSGSGSVCFIPTPTPANRSRFNQWVASHLPPEIGHVSTAFM